MIGSCHVGLEALLKPCIFAYSQPEIPATSIPLPVKNEEFLADLRKTGISISDDCQDRLFRAHGKANKKMNGMIR